MLRDWDTLPGFMQVPEVRPYYDVLQQKKFQLLLKQMLDYAGAVILLVVFAFPMALLAIWIKIDSEGPVFYRQERVTTNGKHFHIHKFRTMVSNADRIGTAVTTNNDVRITKAGKLLRGLRLDELPQLFDVLQGNMSFVGTRPEAVKYVECYQPEFYATLLLPAGITSEASIRYKDEAKLLSGMNDVDKVYIEQVLPAKMQWNLRSVEQFSLAGDIATMIRTVFAVLGKKYK